MANPPTTPLPPAGDDRNLVQVDETYLAPTFEDRVQAFWEKNKSLIVLACAAVLLVIVGRGATSIWQDHQRSAQAADYAAAGDDATALAAFAADHSGSVLAGVAELRLGDLALVAADYAKARGHYDTARLALAGTPFAARLDLSRAIAVLKSGEVAGGTAALQALADDVNLAADARAEATYHLASLAADTGDRDRVTSLVERIGNLTPLSTWNQRATMLLAMLPAAPATPATPAAGDAPAITFPQP
jgi:hypothetical protein